MLRLGALLHPFLVVPFDSVSRSATTEADFGGVSIAEAEGIGFLLRCSRETAISLRICRRVRRPTPGMKISQTPPSRSRIGFCRVSQPLKSPTTLTTRAFGAHTAKRVPVTPSTVSQMRAKSVVRLVIRAFEK